MFLTWVEDFGDVFFFFFFFFFGGGGGGGGEIEQIT